MHKNIIRFNRIRFLLYVFLALLIVPILLLINHPIADHPFFAGLQEQRPLIIAHRGGKGLWPEETLYGFDNAVAFGVDILEMDVHSSADGVLVLMHNDTVDATTNGSGLVQSLTLEELQSLDAGYYWSNDGWKTFPFRGKGITVTTLQEVFQAHPDMRMNIEIKQIEPPIAESLCTLIHEHGMQDRVMVASFYPEAMKEFVQHCPEVARAAGEDEVRTFYIMHRLFLTPFFTPSSHSYQLPEYSEDGTHVLTPEFIEAAQSRNIQVYAWTINDREDMQRMKDLGVDGIITDFPDRLLSLE